jgi:hypothetical protein
VREAQQMVRQVRQSGQPNFALALALRHTARGYFRPLSKNDAVRRTGRYYTPTEVIQLMVDALAPDPESRVLDFACGSGGFLLATAQHWVKRHGASPATVANQLYGVEYDEYAAQVSRVWFWRWGLGAPPKHLRRANTLDRRSGRVRPIECILLQSACGAVLQVALAGATAFQYAGSGKGRANAYEVALHRVSRKTRRAQRSNWANRTRGAAK